MLRLAAVALLTPATTNSAASAAANVVEDEEELKELATDASSNQRGDKCGEVHSFM